MSNQDAAYVSQRHSRLHSHTTSESHDDLYYQQLSNDVVQSWKSVVQAFVAIGTLGAGFVFTIIFSDINLPAQLRPPKSSQEDADATVAYIRTCLMVGWLLFVLALVFSSATVAVLDDRKLDVHSGDTTANGFETFKRNMRAIPWVVLLLMMLPIGAFIATALALLPYHKAFGIAAVVIVGLAGVSVTVYYCSGIISNAKPNFKQDERTNDTERDSDKAAIGLETRASPVPTLLSQRKSTLLWQNQKLRASAMRH